MAATLLELRIRVLDGLNDLQDEVAGTGERYTKSSLNRTINRSMKHYCNHLNTFYQGYLRTSLTINALANTRSYALPSTFRSPIYEVRRTINTLNVPLKPRHLYNFTIPTDPIPNDAWIPCYELQGNTLVLSSAPMSNETAALTLDHQAKLADLATDVSTLDDQLYDAEDCIVIRTIVMMLRAKDVSGAFKNIEGWEGQLADSERVFFAQVGNRYVPPDVPIPTQEFYDYY